MGSLHSESAADREVNSSWPREARSGGRWREVVDACAGIHLKPNTPTPHRYSRLIFEDYLSLLFCQRFAQSRGLEWRDSIINAQKLWGFANLISGSELFRFGPRKVRFIGTGEKQ